MLEVRQLIKEFTTGEGPVRVVNNLSFSIPRGHIFTLCGPSGSGKTTLLRLLAGLEQPQQGVIRLAGRELYHSENKVFIPPHLRNIGMVFQSYALWPHLDVFSNVAFPLEVKPRSQRLTSEERRQKVLQMLERVQLRAYAARSVTSLSGGQQQRVALARALIQEPELLLLDEPLANLDRQLKKQLLAELKELPRIFGVTLLYVTHNPDEAYTLTDQIAMMQEGQITNINICSR